MNWRIVRLIAGRELRDLIRDRRSVMLLVVLPVLLYPGFGLVGYLFAASMIDHESRIGVVGIDRLPSDKSNQLGSAPSIPPLIVNGQFAESLGDSRRDTELLKLVPLPDAGRSPLNDRLVDAMLIVPDDFATRLAKDEPLTLTIENRDGDDASKLATRRLSKVLNRFGDELKAARFSRKNLPVDFDRPLIVREPKDEEPPMKRASDEFRDQLAKFFPFVLVMWALAGALHPAIDVCAGEKERGTMETLLISPAERGEIVTGKFLAVWIYATTTALWNLFWMGSLCLLGEWRFETDLIRPISLLWCALLTLPLTALFSALSIALGVFARSTKEGQYYLVPLFLGVMPLVVLSMMPTIDLSFLLSVIPVTGLCLLIQRMIGPSPASEILPYVAPVLASLSVCVVVACWWAARQFQREDVLFREAETEGRGWLSGFGEPIQ